MFVFTMLTVCSRARAPKPPASLEHTVDLSAKLLYCARLIPGKEPVTSVLLNKSADRPFEYLAGHNAHKISLHMYRQW